MEGIVQSLYLPKFPKSQTCSASMLNSPLLFHSNATSVTFNSASHHLPKCFLFQLPGGVRLRPKAKEKGNLEGGAIHASEATTPTTTNATERWLLEPIGDGDTRHIGFKVEMPGAYEIASSEVTVGRVPDKADLVIPVATVSGVHARILKKQGNLLVTDLDSTNGTFIDDQRLRPGVAVTVSSGSCITFGDTHLAMFRLSKVEDEKVADTAGETEGVYTKRGLRAVPTGLKLDPRQEYDLNVPDSWSGTVWARTGCSGNPNATFHCATGDCGTNKLHCHYNTPHPPVTLAKFTIAPKGGTSSYKVDLRYGFNLPLTLTPFDSKCQKIKCFRDWRNQCPDWLAVYSNDGRKIACKSACFTTGEPKHCCTGAFASPQKCELNPYTELVENQCPSAVSNAFDDTHFTCFGGISYMITFCT